MPVSFFPSKKRQSHSAVYLIVFTSLVSLPVLADETLVVTATPEPPGQHVLSTRQSVNPTTSGDSSEWLKTLPGFSQVRNGGSNSDPLFRGMFGSRLNILADGMGIQGGCGSRMDAPTSYISPLDYDLLEVIKGPQTVIWGPMGSAATLLFERSPTITQNRPYEGEIRLSGGSHHAQSQSVKLKLGSENGYLRLHGERGAAQDYRDGHGEPVPGLWHKWGTGVTLGYTSPTRSLVELSLNSGDGKARYAGRSMDGRRFLMKSLALKMEQYNPSEHLDKVSWQSYYTTTDHVMDNYSLRPDGPMKMASEVGSEVIGSRLSADWVVERSRLSSGLDGQLRQHRRKAHGDWRPDAGIFQLGVFTELHQTLTEEKNVVAGARLDQWYARDKRSGSEGGPRHALLPGLFLRYESQTPGMTFSSGVGYTERFPDYWELFSSRAGQSGFASLKAEKTLQWDNNMHYHSGPYSVWTSVWVNRINDYILFDYRGPMTHARNVDAWSWGGEFGGDWNFAAHWNVGSRLSYVWGEDLTDANPLPQMPPLEIRTTLGYARRDWRYELTWRAVARQSRTAPGQGSVVGQDIGQSPGFGITSFQVGYQLRPQLLLNAGIDNLFDKYYSEHLNSAGVKQFGYGANERIPEPGRVWWLATNYKF